MINVKLLLCADNVIVDQLTNLASAFNILEEITPEGLPFAYPRFVVLSIIERESSDPAQLEGTLQIKIEEDIIIDQTVVIDFQDKLRIHSVFSMFGMPVPRFGILQALLLCENRELGRYEIKVNEPRKTKVTTASA